MLIFLLMVTAFCLGLWMSSRGPGLWHSLRKRPAVPVLFLLLGFVLFLTGCTAAWLSAVSAMLPSILTLMEAVVSFAGGLAGKTVAASAYTFIQGVAADINTEITEAQTLIADYNANPAATTLQKLSATFNGIVASLGTILNGVNITDAGTVGKLTQLVGLAVAAVQAVLGLIPLVANTMEKYSGEVITSGAAEHADQQASALVAHHHKALRDGYHNWKTTPTGEAEVDAVLATLPETI